MGIVKGVRSSEFGVRNENLLLNSKLSTFAVSAEVRSKLLIAVSGGADSMALLHSLLTECRIGGRSLIPNLSVAHVNHQINIAEANAAQSLVEAFCRKHGIDCHVGTFNVPQIARDGKRGIEETARHLRYGFFAEILEKINYDYYLTAHTADDNAETLMLHLLRGCGPKGLCGMPVLRGKHMRPILHVTRKQVEEYVAEHNIDCAVDSSNSDCDYTRNKIRHELLPLMREFNPQINGALNRLAHAASSENECLTELAEKLLHTNEQGQPYCLKIELENAPYALRVRALQALYPFATGLEQKHFTAMLQAVERHSGTELPNALRLNVRKGVVTIGDNPALTTQ